MTPEEKMEMISSGEITREDLENVGFDSSKVDEEALQKITSEMTKLAGEFCRADTTSEAEEFYSSLQWYEDMHFLPDLISVAERLGIPENTEGENNN